MSKDGRTDNVNSLRNVSHEDPIIRSFTLFVQTAGAVSRYADSRFYECAHLSMAKYVALKALDGGTMTHAELAAWTNTKRHNITTLVERMSRDGLVKTERDQKDRRVIHIMLTDKGREAFEQASPVARSVREHFMHGIGKDKALQLESLLRTMRENL
jgi:DNA-binding MarR family transcriptional regulator